MKEKVIFTTALCLSTMTQMMAQNITGKVMNTKGEPLAFANVVLLNRTDSAFVKVNPAKRNVLDLKNETCKNREKRNVLKKSHTRHFKAIKKQSRTGLLL